MDFFIERFRPMYEFFMSNFYLIPAIVGGCILLEAIAFLVLAIVNKKRNGFFSYNYVLFFEIAIITLLGLVLLYALVAFGFSFAYQINQMDWRFWTLYMNFIHEQKWIPIIFYVLNGIIAIAAAGYGYSHGIFGCILGLVAGALGGALALGVLFMLIFLIYVIIATLIYIVICLGIGFACLGVSIFKFFEANWIVAACVFLAPGIFVGLIVAMKNYVASLGDNLSSSISESKKAIKFK